LPAGNHTVVLAGSGIYMAVGITVGATTLPTTGGDSSAVVVMALLIFALAAVLVRSRRLATITR
jgi:LPXTG-motif cell wall-anchored protein